MSADRKVTLIYYAYIGISITWTMNTGGSLPKANIHR